MQLGVRAIARSGKKSDATRLIPFASIGSGSKKDAKEICSRFSEVLSADLKAVLPAFGAHSGTGSATTSTTTNQGEGKSPSPTTAGIPLRWTHDPQLPSKHYAEDFVTEGKWTVLGFSFDETAVHPHPNHQHSLGATLGPDDEQIMWLYHAGSDVAFPTSLAEVKRLRRFSQWAVEAPPSPTANPRAAQNTTPSTRNLLVALRRGVPIGNGEVGAGNVLLQLALETFEEVQQLSGITNMNEVNFEDQPLKLTFPFYAGNGEHTVKSYFDIRRETLSRFGPNWVYHGSKVLSPYGSVVCVGARPMEVHPSHTPTDSELSESAVIHWQPLGQHGCAIAPIISASRNFAFDKALGEDSDDHKTFGCAVPIGEVKLLANGPHATDLEGGPLSAEPLARYLKCSGDIQKDGRAGCDQSEWLCKGLFGLSAGQPIPGRPGFEAVGVAVDAVLQKLSLYCQPISGKRQGTDANAATNLVDLASVLMFF